MKNAKSGLLGGFTLIELLVVVLIIGILAAVALPQYRVAVAKSRLSQAFVLAKSIKDAEEVYYLANGEYTTDLEALSVDVGAHAPSTNTSTYFLTRLANEYRLEIGIKWAGSLEDRVAVFLPQNNILVGIQYFLDHPTSTHTPPFQGVYCVALDVVYQKACQAMGGVYRNTGSAGEKIYQLPL